MSHSVQVFIVFPLFDAGCLWRNDGQHSGFFQPIAHALPCIVGLVSQEGLNIGEKRGQSRVSPVQIVRLSRREGEAGRIAPRIAGRRDFGGQPALAASDRFLFAVPLLHLRGYMYRTSFHTYLDGSPGS